MTPKNMHFSNMTSYNGVIFESYFTIGVIFWAKSGEKYIPRKIQNQKCYFCPLKKFETILSKKSINLLTLVQY